VSTSHVVSSRRATDEPGDEIVRYTFSERVHHWVGSVFYIYCLITGLAFWSPYLYWLAAIVGGGPTARFWHPWFGLAFTVSMVWMYKMWQADVASSADDRGWSDGIKYYIENEDEKLPPVGRFNYGQKIFFWLMFYGVILLLLSGLGLWFVESIPWSLRWLRYLAVTVHVTAALATIGAFIIHVYMSVFMEPESFHAMIRGRVSAVWARTYHRLWYERVTGDKNGSGRP
jgi:formate dehydrogenase subunit gamma